MPSQVAEVTRAHVESLVAWLLNGARGAAPVALPPNVLTTLIRWSKNQTRVVLCTAASAAAGGAPAEGLLPLPADIVPGDRAAALDRVQLWASRYFVAADVSHALVALFSLVMYSKPTVQGCKGAQLVAQLCGSPDAGVELRHAKSALRSLLFFHDLALVLGPYRGQLALCEDPIARELTKALTWDVSVSITPEQHMQTYLLFVAGCAQMATLESVLRSVWSPGLALRLSAVCTLAAQDPAAAFECSLYAFLCAAVLYS